MEVVLDEWTGIRCQERIFNISSEAKLLSVCGEVFIFALGD